MGKRTLVLTESKAGGIKPNSKKIADGTVIGLWLVPSTRKGQGYWIFRYASPVTGRRHEMSLGPYPAVSIATARTEALAARSLLARAMDPLIERHKEKVHSEVGPVVTFKSAARKLYEQKRRGWKNGKHHDQWISTLENYVFPIIGNRPVDSLKPNDFQTVLSPIWLEKPETASRVRQRCDAVMKWCWAQQLVQSNPVTVVDLLLPNMPPKRVRTTHQPSVPWQELPSFVRNVLNDGTVGTCRQVLEATILTGARSGEIRPMQWDEIDFPNKVWNVPASRMKNKCVHRVPLSWRMLEILDYQKKAHPHPTFVFPSPRGVVLSDATLTKFLKDHKVKSDIPDRYATAHGFRSTLRTWGTDHGYSREVMEKVLSHSEKDALVAAYTRTDQLEQRRPIMDDWAYYVCGRTQPATKSR